MLNMLKYQFYRLSRSISTYISVALLIIFNIMIVAMNASTPGAQEGDEALSTFMDAVDFASFGYVSIAMPMVFSAWAVIFAYGEFHQGYIRNIASSVKSKCSFFFSHIIVCAFVFLVMSLFGGATAVISAKFMVANIEWGDFGHLLQVVLMELFVHLIFSALALLAVYFFRNIFIPLIVTFGVSLGLETIPLLFVQNIIDGIGVKGSDTINQWLNHTSVYMNITMVEFALHKHELHRFFIVGGLMLVLYSVLACLAITKKDIK